MPGTSAEHNGAMQAASVALLLVILLRSSESVGIKAAVLMLLLLIAVSGMVITQHFAQLASMPQGQQEGAAVQAPAQQSRNRPSSQLRQEPSDSRQRSAQGASTLSHWTRRVLYVRVATLQPPCGYLQICQHVLESSEKLSMAARGKHELARAVCAVSTTMNSHGAMFMLRCQSVVSRLHSAGAADALSTGPPNRSAPTVEQNRVSSVSAARDILDRRHGVADASVEGGSDWSDFSSEGSAEDSREQDEEVSGMCSHSMHMLSGLFTA